MKTVLLRVISVIRGDLCFSIFLPIIPQTGLYFNPSAIARGPGCDIIVRVKLTAEQESVLSGDSGRAAALAMKTLAEYGAAFDAQRLVPIASGHLAGSFGISIYKAYFEVLDMMIAEGVRVKVKTTVNPRSGHDRNLLSRIALHKQKRLERQLDAIGVTPNYSCVCYDGANVPALGDRLAWAESSAVQYANSALGARTNRNSIVIDVCSAVTGLTPEFGYLLDENRRGRLLIKLDVARMDASALGFIVGRTAVDHVPVIEHHAFNSIELKNMGGSMAASGAVALFHVEGVTPEAPDMKTAFAGREPEDTVTIKQSDLDALRFANPNDAGIVVFGCPQMTAAEAAALAPAFDGRRVARPTWFCMIPDAIEQFEKTKEYEMVRAAGVRVKNFCPLAAFSMHFGAKPILTPSGKLYYYLADAEYGTIEDCLRAAGAQT